MAKKSTTEWADILGPARDFEAAVTKTRSLRDLPLVRDGAKEVALLSIFKEEQRFAFEPVMRALQNLSQLEDWAHSFFVCDRVESEFFDWRKMPLRKYSSFQDFYQRELEPVWGKWERLQHTWNKVVKGKITEDEGRRIVLNREGRHPKYRGNNFDVTTVLKPNERNSRIHILVRLDHHRPDLAAKVRAKTMSANAAAIEAGFRKKPVHKKQSRVDKARNLLKQMTRIERREIWNQLKKEFE